MSKTSRCLIGYGLATVLLGTAAADPAYAQQAVGVVGAANGAPTGRAPGKPQRTLKAGSDIFFKDRIVVRRGGSAQLAFLDRSTLNVSENSDLVIDEFVYRPGEAGKMTAHLSKGIVRFVGGDVSHDGGTTIQTPVVTIGIRGGIGTIGYVADGAKLAAIPGVPANFHGGAIVVNGYGTLTVSNGASQTVISRPGFAVFVGSANEAIAAPVRFDMAAAKAMTNAVASRAGQRGGLSARGAARAAVKIDVVRLSVPVAVPHPPSVNALDFTSVFHVGNALARNRSQTMQTMQLQTQVAMPVSNASPVAVTSAGPTSLAVTAPRLVTVPTSVTVPTPVPTRPIVVPPPVVTVSGTTSPPASASTASTSSGNPGRHLGWGYYYGYGYGYGYAYGHGHDH